MSAKSFLQSTTSLPNILFIEDARSLSSTINESNMMKVLQELGKKEQHFLSSNGRIVRKGANVNERNQRDQAQR